MMGKNDNLNPEEQKKKGYYPTVVRKQTVEKNPLDAHWRFPHLQAPHGRLPLAAHGPGT